jgi:hypothetical protein
MGKIIKVAPCENKMSEDFRKCERLFRKFTQLRGLAEDEPLQENLRKPSEDKPLVDSVKRTCG